VNISIKRSGLRTGSVAKLRYWSHSIVSAGISLCLDEVILFILLRKVKESGSPARGESSSVEPKAI